MAVTLLRRLAARGPAPVYAAAGAGAGDAVEALGLRRELRLVDTPRHAALLLIAGEIPEPLREPVQRLHDQLPHPRATLWWSSAPFFPGGATAGGGPGEAAAALADLYRHLWLGRRASEEPLLPDEPPAPWRGVGPHGQGGEGMMGGKPYGRPMPMTADDLRDGLALDRLPLCVGPFFPPFPEGLVLELALQGDVVQEAAVASLPFPAALPEPFGGALRAPVSIAALELARARHHLRRIARLLRVVGAEAAAARALRAAHAADSAIDSAVWSLLRFLRRTAALRALPSGVGVLPRETAAALGGPAARAAGLAQDRRSSSFVYRRLGFEVLTQRDGDTRARLRQRLAETVQSLELARRAARRDLQLEPSNGLEGPQGALEPAASACTAAIESLPAMLPGLEWGDTVATIASFDLAPMHAVGRGAS